MNCASCSENESINHLFFDCVVDKCIWAEMSDLFQVHIGPDFQSIANFWISSKKHAVSNSFIAAALWCLWKCRTEIIFQRKCWLSMRQIWRKVFTYTKVTIPGYKVTADKSLLRVAGGSDTEGDEVDIKMWIDIGLGVTLIQCGADEN